MNFINDGVEVSLDVIVDDWQQCNEKEHSSSYNGEYTSITVGGEEITIATAIFLMSLRGIVFKDVPKAYPFAYIANSVVMDLDNMYSPYTNTVISHMITCVVNYGPLKIHAEYASVLCSLISKFRCESTLDPETYLFIRQRACKNVTDVHPMWIMYEIIQRCSPHAYASLVSAAITAYARAYGRGCLDQHMKEHSPISGLCLSWYLFPYLIYHETCTYTPNPRTNIWQSGDNYDPLVVLREYRKTIAGLISQLDIPASYKMSQTMLVNNITCQGNRFTVEEIKKTLLSVHTPFRQPSNHTVFNNGVIIGGEEQLIIRPIMASDMVLETPHTRILNDNLPGGMYAYKDRDLADLYMKQLFPDPDVRETVLRLLAMTFIGYNKEKVVIMGYGARGDEGKSLFSVILQEMFGDRYSSVASPNLLVGVENKTAGSHTSHLDPLIGKKVVFIDEGADASSTLSPALLKRTRGNNKMYHRTAYGRGGGDSSIMFEGVLWFISNTLPGMPLESCASDYNSLFFIPFESRFVKVAASVDVTTHTYLMNADLVNNKSNIAGWILHSIIEAYPRYYKYGLAITPGYRMAKPCLALRNRYIERNNPFLAPFMNSLWAAFHRTAGEYPGNYPVTHQDAAIIMGGHQIDITVADMPTILYHLQQLTFGGKVQPITEWESVMKYFTVVCNIYELSYKHTPGVKLSVAMNANRFI